MKSILLILIPVLLLSRAYAQNDPEGIVDQLKAEGQRLSEHTGEAVPLELLFERMANIYREAERVLVESWIISVDGVVLASGVSTEEADRYGSELLHAYPSSDVRITPIHYWKFVFKSISQ